MEMLPEWAGRKGGTASGPSPAQWDAPTGRPATGDRDRDPDRYETADPNAGAGYVVLEPEDEPVEEPVDETGELSSADLAGADQVGHRSGGGGRRLAIIAAVSAAAGVGVGYIFLLLTG